MAMKQQSAAREQMLARRAQVAHLLLAGSPQRLIVKQIGVSAATVNRDARVLGSPARRGSSGGGHPVPLRGDSDVAGQRSGGCG